MVNESDRPVSHRRVKIHPFFRFALGAALLTPAGATEPDQTTPRDHDDEEEHPSLTLAEKTLRDIIARQNDLFAKAAQEGDNFDGARFHGEAQALASSYDVLIQKNPTYAAGFAAYGVFLGRVGMTKPAVAILLQANKLDANIALVKNQIAKHLYEDGKPLEALPWITAAIDLEPKEPLYHYQLGTMLHDARDDFLTSGSFTRAALDRAMLEAFQRAADLSPADLSLAYRHAKAHFEAEPPRYEEVLPVLDRIEQRATTPALRQLVRLRRAEALLKLDRRDEARRQLEGVTDQQLAQEKQTLLDQLAPTSEKK
jgi:tetratricopeptide (TPR) repeat protein